jgi:transcriptional regulator MraZ
VAFRGTFDYSLDAKNRLTVPAKFRAALSDGVVLAKGVETCVELWPTAAYESFTTEALRGFHRLSNEGRKLRTFFAANSHDTELDSAGRVMIPPFLLEHANLAKEVVVTGAEDCLQVWDRPAWGSYNDLLTGEIADITAQLGHSA